MAEDKITAAETANEGTKKSENIVELARPYGFEGKEYGEGGFPEIVLPFAHSTIPSDMRIPQPDHAALNAYH